MGRSEEAGLCLFWEQNTEKLNRPRVEGLSTSGHGVPSSLGLYLSCPGDSISSCGVSLPLPVRLVGVLLRPLQVVASCLSVTAHCMREGPRPQCVRTQ